MKLIFQLEVNFPDGEAQDFKITEDNPEWLELMRSYRDQKNKNSRVKQQAPKHTRRSDRLSRLGGVGVGSTTIIKVNGYFSVECEGIE